MGCQSSCQQTPRDLETRCGREGHTRTEGDLRKSPDGVDPKTSGWASKRTRKTQRDGHNSGVKIWSLCSVSSTLSHANLQQPFRTLAIKWEVNIFLKKSSCVFLPASFFQAFSFMRLSLMLCRCDAWTCKWLYNNTYLLILSVKQGGIKYHFSSLWLNPGLPDHLRTIYSLGQWTGETSFSLD